MRGGWRVVSMVAGVWACTMAGLLVVLVAGATGVAGTADVDGPGPFVGLTAWALAFTTVAVVARRRDVASRPPVALAAAAGPGATATATAGVAWSTRMRVVWATGAAVLIGGLMALASTPAAGAWMGAGAFVLLLASTRPR